MTGIAKRSALRCAGALVLSASPLALCVAQAQPVSPTDGSAEVQTSAPAGAEAESSGIEEIVVTAQRRAEAAQDVPISLQAFSADTLRKAVVESTEDLTSVVGGLIVQPSAARPALFIRGVGTNSSNTTPAVLTFIDGIYQPFGASSDLVNINSVEVLKGPQGTLFGRNATGGVIQIRTAPPSETLGGRVEAGYGNYNTVDASAYVTGGLANGIAMDLALRYRNQSDGFGTNVFNGEDVFLSKRFTARSRIRFELGEDTNLTIGGDYSRQRGTVGANVSPAVGYGVLFVNGALRSRGTAFYPGDFDVNANLHPRWKSKEWGVNATFETKFSDITFRSLSSYRRSSEDIHIDFDGGPANTTNLGIKRDPREGYTQELQLLSDSGGKFEWVVGAFYYHANWNSDPFQLCSNGNNLDTIGCGPVAHAKDYTRSLAGYAQGTYEVLPETRLTLGGRYTHEKRRTKGFVTVGGAVIPARTGDLSQTINEPTWRIALDHKFTPEVMVYGSVSRSFNSGFYNQANFGGFANETQNPAVRPEFLTVYEIGGKTEFLDRKLRVNLSGYFYKYNDLQQQIYDQGAVKTINAGSAEIKGIDFEIVARPIRALTLSWTGTYLDTKYTSYDQAPNYVVNPNGSITAGIVVNNTVIQPPSIDAAGNRIVNAPRWSWTANASHELSTSIGQFTTTATLNYRGQTFADPANRFKLPTRYVLNASERWTSLNDKFFVTIWAENLLDKRYDYAINILTPAGLVGNTAPPRTYGISAGVNF